MTPKELLELAERGDALAKEATSGDWKFAPASGYLYAPDCQVAVFGDMRDKGIAPFNRGRWSADGSQAAFLHNHWPQLSAALRALAEAEEAPPFDLIAHLERQRQFSARTFGPGPRTASVCDHIRKELDEVQADPSDKSEWVDVIILALDGAWRAGYEPREMIDAIVAKQTKNEARKWPDWRTAPAGRTIEHDRSEDAALSSIQKVTKP
jgi:hypothetical protein